MKTLSIAALFGTSLICLSVSPLVLADETDSLDSIVVTADRKAQTVDATLAPVSVITRKDIEKYQATSIPEVLRRVPGINIVNSGGMGKITSVFLRGTNSDHLLVLVDGVKMGSATLGSVAFEDIPLDQVERIEVVRGPRSSLYGSEAIGGVIQIFTRKGGKGFHPEISVSAGSHNTQKADVNLAGGDQNTWYNLNAGHTQTDGINVCSSTTSGCYANQPDLDGYRRESASLRVGHHFEDGTTAEVSALNATGNNHYDGTSSNEDNFTQQAISGKLKKQVTEKIKLSAQLGQSRDEMSNLLNGVPVKLGNGRTYNTRRDTASLQADIQTGKASSLSIGVDQQHDAVDSDLPYTVTSRKDDGIFTAYQQQFGANKLDISARHDDNEQFGKHNTGGIAIGHDINDSLRVKASYGTAFKAPTFNQLYYPGFGAPNLQPEQSKNTEIGLSGKLGEGKTSWSANAFSNSIDNLISYPPPTYQISQTAKARIQGMELGAKTQLAGFDISSNITLQNPKDANAHQLLASRPKHIANVDVDRRFGKFSAGATVHGESKRYSDTANTESAALPGYGTLDLRTDYKLSKDWTVGAKFGNVLNKHYQTNAGYNQDGANYLITFKYAPK